VGIPATSAFDLAVDDLIEAATARAGGSNDSAWGLDSARRALNLLFQTITNRGICLWQLELATLALVSGSITQTLPTDTVDIMQGAVVKDTAQASSIDLPMMRIGYDAWLMLPNKGLTGQPTQFLVERPLSGPVLRVYPTPRTGAFVMTYWRIRKPKDAVSFSDNVEYPARWQPALVSGLAYFMALDRPKVVSPADRSGLKAQWEQDFAEAAAEYVDRTDLVLSVDLSCYARI
jgi:hypothetical protein